MKSTEKWGDSVDSAVELALQDLGLNREQVNVTVLEEPSKGFLGIGAKLALVRVEEIVKEVPKPAKKEKPAAETVKEDVQPAKPEKEKKHKKERKPKEDAELSYGVCSGLNERPADLTEMEDHPAKTFLMDIAKEMELDINIKVSGNNDTVFVDVDGPDSGTVIGKRGQTLDALQYLTSLVVNKDENGYIRVVVDAEGYREKREKTLEKLANRLADKAVKSGRHVRLEPMNPYERKVIHTTLQSRPEVNTKSEGEEPYRRVVIEPVK